MIAEKPSSAWKLSTPYKGQLSRTFPTFLNTSLGTRRCPWYSYVLSPFTSAWSLITMLAIFPCKSQPTQLRISKPS